MTTKQLGDILAHSPPIGLDALDQVAAMHTRKDRKYIIDSATIWGVLADLSEPIQVLEIAGNRWFDYESVYFDTRDLDSYRLAATGRPSRFKVRTRTYVQAGTTVLEVKTKDRRGRTVKHRCPYDANDESLAEAVRAFATTVEIVAPYAARLEPILTSSYRRATIVMPASGTRATIDANFAAGLDDGSGVGLTGEYILETKTHGRPSGLDRLLWRTGQRPVKISKYATGLAALRPELQSNRWHRVLGRMEHVSYTAIEQNSIEETSIEQTSTQQTSIEPCSPLW